MGPPGMFGSHTSNSLSDDDVLNVDWILVLNIQDCCIE